MGRLGRRLDALEAAEEEVRIAPYRRLAAEYNVPLDALLAEVDEITEFVEHHRRRGISLDELLTRCADRWGLPLDALRRAVEGRGVHER
jgi:hypothetical protein